jgi:predicted alpha/beta hydrolase
MDPARATGNNESMTTPIVLISTAMAVSSRFYAPLVDAFAERGWEAEALPRRGFERGLPVASRGVDWGYDDEISDIADAVAKARADHPERPVILLGHSLGAQLGAGHQLHRAPADGFVCVAASVPHAKYFPHAGIPLMTLGTLIPIVTAVRGFVPSPFFGAPGARTMMREWARIVRTGRPPFAVPRRITTPTLSVRLEGDSYAVPASNERYVELFVEPSALTEWTYRKDAVPEGGTTHHIHWVRTPGPVADRVVSWWESRA